MNGNDHRLLLEAFQSASRARAAGNHPFGAVLADGEGKILLRAENTVVGSNDCTAHAEMNLVRAAAQQFTPDELAHYSLYASTEPCPMCAGAIFWAGVGRVVYGLSETSLYELTGSTPHKLLLSCREVFSRGGRLVEIVGPMLETEARGVHEGFWSKASSGT